MYVLGHGDVMGPEAARGAGRRLASVALLIRELFDARCLRPRAARGRRPLAVPHGLALGEAVARGSALTRTRSDSPAKTRLRARHVSDA